MTTYCLWASSFVSFWGIWKHEQESICVLFHRSSCDISVNPSPLESLAARGSIPPVLAALELFELWRRRCQIQHRWNDWALDEKAESYREQIRGAPCHCQPKKKEKDKGWSFCCYFWVFVTKNMIFANDYTVDQTDGWTRYLTLRCDVIFKK